MALGEDGRQHGEPPCAVERPEPSELTGFRRFDADPEATIAMPVAAPPPAPAERFAAGETIDHYEIIRPLGRGGMSDVYLARDTRLGRRVALKFLSQVDPQQAARFEVEARTTAQLVHENIVTLHDVGEHRGLPYMVLEHVPGKTLAAWLRERREEGSPATVPPARAAEMMLPVARALRCAHAAGIVHRDLKPSNIMLADSGTVKVLDFGIAKLVGAPAAARSRHPTRPPAAPPETTSPAEPSSEAVAGALTQVGTVLGTHAYMAPEQWWSEPIDGRTDLWAVGVILYLMVRGEHPLGAVSSDLLLSAALHREVPMPSALEQAPEVGALGALIDRCLVKDPVDRLGSADELCAVLEAIARPHAAGRPEDESPYSGLAAFQERDAGRFFGRERVIEQISSRLADQPLLALLGPSGAGKSSLVRAGVIPALKRGGEAWETFVLRPGPRPLLSLAELLLQHVGQRTGGADHATGDPAPPSGRDAASTLAQRLRLEPGLFGAELRGRARRRRERALLFVDQFEEVYTLASEDEREAFCASLSGAADDAASPLRVMVALRHDFLDRVAASASALSDLIGRGTVLLAPLDPPALRRALVEPAEALGYRFESEALVDEMLASLADTASALPILQFTAAKLWEGRDRARRVLTEASYRAFGGVGGALASHADSVLGTLNSMERRSARALFLHLVTPERTRAIATRRELGSLGAPEGAPTIDRVLARLVEARLVTVGGAGEDESTVELLHESLIQAWPTLAGWLSEAEGDAQIRTRLAAAAREWEASGRPEGLLWRGEAAQEARRWQARHAEADAALLSAREARFLAALLALGDRERRRRRQLLGGLFAALVLVVFVVSALAVRSNRAAARALAEQLEAQARRADAERSRADAEQSAARARNATRLAAARERQADPTLALALLREIEPGAPPRGWAEFARWAAEAGVSLEVHPHDAPVRGVAVSPDGQRYASAAWDKTVRVFRADGKGEPLVLRGHEDRVFSVAFSPDGQRVVSASGDKTVRVFRADGTGEPLVLRGHDALVYAAAFSPDGQRIVSASGDKTVRVSRADGKGEPLVLRGHEGGVYAAAWSPDGRRVVTGGGDKTVRLWSADGKGEPLVLRGHEDGVFAVAFSPDGKRVAAGSLDRTLRVWRADGEGAPVIVRGHGGGVYGVAFSPDGRRLVTASVDKTLSVHDADGKGQPLVLRGHADGVYAAAFTPDGRHVISGSWDKTVRVWSASPAAGQPVVLRGHDDSVYTAAMSPDGRRLASASWDKTVRVWDPAGVEPPRVLRGHEAGVYSAAFDPEGRRLVSASWDKTVRIWDLAETAPPLVLRGHEDAVYGAAFSPDGRRVVSASLDKTVRVWSADGKGEPLVLRGHDAGVYGAAFSPDGLAIASASIDKTVRVWSADGKGEPRILRGHEDAVYGVAWSPDGRRIATASLDKTVRVWSADGKGEPRILRGHEAPASVRGERAWSPDGARLVSSSDDATVRVWSADGEGEPLILRASSAALNSASWSPDGRQLLAASDDGTIVLWSDLVPLRGADDPRLWSATRYCPSPELRERLLGFSPPQSRADLERCQQRVREAHAEPR